MSNHRITITLSESQEKAIKERCKEKQEFMESLNELSDTSWSVKDELEFLLEKIIEEKYGK